MNSQIQPFYDRQRSGYRREYGMLDVFMINILGYSLGLALSTNPAFIGGFVPTANIVIVILLGAVLAVFNGLVYGWFGGIMPSTGGDYVFVTRSVSHRIGFLTSWGFTFCQVYGMAVNIGWIFSMAIIPSITTLTQSITLPDIAYRILKMTNLDILIASFVIIVVYYLFTLLNLKMRKILSIFIFLLGMLGPVLMCYVLFSNDHQQFIHCFDSFMAAHNGMPHAYQDVIVIANKITVNTESGKWAECLKGLPLGFLCFLGFTYSVYAGGQVEKPEKSQIIGIMGALGIGIIIFCICMGRYVTVCGPAFNSVIGTQEVLDQLRIPAAPTNLLVGIMTPNPIINVLIQIGNLVWFLFVPYIMLQVCTKNVIAWACDGMMPEWCLKRMPKTNAPWAASLLVVSVGIVAMLIVYLTEVSLVGAVALAAVAYLFTSFGAMRLPTVNPKAFAKAPRIAKLKVFDLPVTFFQLAGLVSFIGFSYIIYAAIKYPMIAQGTSLMAVAMITVVYFFGLVFYQIRKNKLLRKEDEFRDFDPQTLFKEIPID